MGNKICGHKVEAFLRLLAFLTLFVSATVMVVDSQTKVIFGYYKQVANYKLMTIARMYVIVNYLGAGYSLIQFVRCLAFTSSTGPQGDGHLTLSTHLQKWTYFSLDQVTVYMVFATNCAVTEAAFLVLFGTEAFQWMKLCSKFTRFCVKMGGAIFCGLVATLILVVISAVSAFNLFRWYSPNFLCLKPKKIGIISPTSQLISHVCK